MRKVRVAAIQFAMKETPEENIATAERLVRQAATDGANVVLIPELFERPYFCQERRYEYYEYADRVEENLAIRRFQEVCKELHIVVPISFYERSGNVTFNSVEMIDADGSLLGIYRKTHIPDDHYYQEKFYFTPGDLGFHPIPTSVGLLGVQVCWDQWYPEGARLMALQGADLLIYPTAIGYESSDTPAEQERQREAWITVQRGHAVANGLPVVSVNRVGHEPDPSGQTRGIQFWGSSFVAGPQGELLHLASQTEEEIAVVDIDLKRSENVRQWWPFLRDRRIEEFQPLTRRFID